MTSVWSLEPTRNWGPEFDLQNPRKNDKNSGIHSKSQCREVETWVLGACRASQPSLIKWFSTENSCLRRQSEWLLRKIWSWPLPSTHLHTYMRKHIHAPTQTCILTLTPSHTKYTEKQSKNCLSLSSLCSYNRKIKLVTMIHFLSELRKANLSENIQQ